MANSAWSGNTSGLASATSPGLVGTGAQTFAGDKTLTGLTTASGGIINTGLTGANATAVTTSGSLKVGEIVQFTERSVNSGTVAWAGSTLALGQLTTGFWLIFSYCVFSSGSSATSVQCKIATNNSSDATGMLNNAFLYAVPSSSKQIGGPLGPSYLLVSVANQSIYAKATSEVASVSCVVGGYAVRII